jgi:hypothetical protein
MASVHRRLSDLGSAAVLLLIMVALYLLTASVIHLYRGNQDVRGRPVTGGTATVGACQRSGPVSRYGLGYWWTCEATVQLEDGRTVATRLTNSVVTPTDRGTLVPIVEVCDKSHHCYYWRPGNRVVAVAMRLLDVAAVITLVGLAGSFYVIVMQALLGRRAYAFLFRKRRPTHWTSVESTDATDTVEKPTAGQGVLCVRFRYQTASSVFFEQSKPTLVVDGIDVPVQAWSLQTVALSPGRHRIAVRISSAHSDGVGTARRDITVDPDKQLMVTYDAPATPGSPGSLRLAGEPDLDIATGRAVLVAGVLVVATYLLLRRLL